MVAAPDAYPQENTREVHLEELRRRKLKVALVSNVIQLSSWQIDNKVFRCPRFLC